MASDKSAAAGVACAASYNWSALSTYDTAPLENQEGTTDLSAVNHFS